MLPLWNFGTSMMRSSTTQQEVQFQQNSSKGTTRAVQQNNRYDYPYP